MYFWRGNFLSDDTFPFMDLPEELRFEIINRFTCPPTALTVSKYFHQYISRNANRLRKCSIRSLFIVNVNRDMMVRNWRSGMTPEDHARLKPIEYKFFGFRRDDQELESKNVMKDFKDPFLWKLLAHIQARNVFVDCVYVSFELMELIRRLQCTYLEFKHCYFHELANMPSVFDAAFKKHVRKLHVYKPADFTLPITPKIQFSNFYSIVLHTDLHTDLLYFDDRFLMEHLGGASQNLCQFYICKNFHTSVTEPALIRIVERWAERKYEPKLEMISLGTISRKNCFSAHKLPIHFQVRRYGWTIECLRTTYHYDPEFDREIIACFDHYEEDSMLWVWKCHMEYSIAGMHSHFLRHVCHPDCTICNID